MINLNSQNSCQALLMVFIALIVCSSCSKKTEDCIDDVAKNAKTESGVAIGVTNCRIKALPPVANEISADAKESKKCAFVWSDEAVNFEEVHSVSDKFEQYKSTHLVKSGVEINDFRELERQFIKAHEDGNHELARSIVKALREKMVTIYYKPHLTQEFIHLMIKDKNLQERCVN